MTPEQYKATMNEIKGMIASGNHDEAVARVFSVADQLGEQHACAMLRLIGMA